MSPRKTVKPKAFPLLFVWIVAGVVLACVLIVWISTGPFQAIPSSSPGLDNASLVAKVGKLILINPNEEPTIATVQDPDTLRQTNPIFYKDAQVGDRLLIWSDKAVLYSESKNLILAVLPVTFTPPPAQGASTSTVMTATSTAQLPERLDLATIEVRNGTRKSGLAKTLADTLTSLGYKVLKPTDAKSKGYDKSVLFENSVSTSTDSIIGSLSKVTGFQSTSTKPSNEGNLTGDILIIIGADYPQ